MSNIDVLKVLPWIETTEVHPKIDGGVHVIRFLVEASDAPYAAFGGVCTVDVTGKTARIYAMHGNVRRCHIRALLDWVMGMGVNVAKADRTPLHSLPGGKREGDWMVIDLVALKKRI